jgi:hypothetical protein
LIGFRWENFRFPSPQLQVVELIVFAIKSLHAFFSPLAFYGLGPRFVTRVAFVEDR